jgi:predicted MFS family arabinose efflux permease
VGVAGAAAAPLVGRYADVRGDRKINALGIGVLLASFAVLWLLGQWLWGIALGVILLDLGAQSNHISNQTRVYSLRPEARSRLNTVYMVTYFVGGATGAWLGTSAWVRFGWTGVCLVGGGLALLALGVLGWGTSRASPRPS